MEQTIADHIPRGEELIALAVLEAKKVIEEKNAKIAEMTPKAIFADAVATSKTSILIGELAKIIKQKRSRHRRETALRVDAEKPLPD